MIEFATKCPIGIDLNDGCLTAAQFRKSRKSPRVRGLLSQLLPMTLKGEAGEDEALVDALKTVRSSGLFTGKRVVFSLPLQDLSFFPVHFPVNPKEDPEEGIFREASKLLSYPPDEAMIDYLSLFKIRDDFHATVVAARREVVNRWVVILRRAGYTAEVIDSYISSLIRIHQRSFAPKDQIDIICHVGRTFIMLVVLSGEEIISISEISWGIQLLRDKIETNLALSPGGQEALMLLSTYGLGSIDRGSTPEEATDDKGIEEENNIFRTIFQIISPTINELAYECHNSIGFVRSIRENASFGKVYLYGLAGLISQLDRYLEEQLEMPVHLVDLKEHLDVADSKHPVLLSGDISPAPVLGLAMRDLSWL